MSQFSSVTRLRLEDMTAFPAVMLAVVALSTCEDLGTLLGDDDPNAVAEVEITSTSTSLAIGETTQLEATARDAEGNTLSGVSISWSSSDAAVAAVDETGLLTGVAAGEAAITATAGGESGTLSVAVTSTSPPPPPPPPPGEAVWFDDFSYADEADFEANFANEPGGSRAAPSGATGGCAEMLVNFDAAVNAMRYDYWDKVSDPTGEQTFGQVCGSEANAGVTIAYGRIFSPSISGSSVWVRVVSKEGTPENGFSIATCDTCGGIYKFFQSDWDSSQLFGVQGTGGDKFGFNIRMLGFEINGFPSCVFEHPGIGEWHIWVYGFSDNGAVAEVWVDGELRCSGSLTVPGAMQNYRPGWNINAGPHQEQNRWIAEVGVYLSRPQVN